MIAKHLLTSLSFSDHVNALMVSVAASRRRSTFDVE